jgi:hypothetical protein
MGAVIGGVAEHFAGHHGLAGAGCVIGHHEANKHFTSDLPSRGAAPRSLAIVGALARVPPIVMDLVSLDEGGG